MVELDTIAENIACDLINSYMQNEIIKINPCFYAHKIIFIKGAGFCFSMTTGITLDFYKHELNILNKLYIPYKFKDSFYGGYLIFDTQKILMFAGSRGLIEKLEEAIMKLQSNITMLKDLGNKW